MPYKHNSWATIVRKRNYNKGPPADFSAPRPVHSVQTGSSFCHLPDPCLLVMTGGFSDARYVKYDYKQNLVCNTSAHSLYDNKHDYLNTEGLHRWNHQ